jgi:hypothetical protein
VGYFNGMWRVMMLDEGFLPSNNEDKDSRVEAYCILKGVMEAARNEANIILRMLNSNVYRRKNYGNSSHKRENDNILIIEPPKKEDRGFFTLALWFIRPLKMTSLLHTNST